MQSPRSYSSSGEFYQTFNKELRPILLKLLQETEEERTLPNLFYDARINPISRSDRNTTKKKKKEKCKPMSLMNIDV